MTAAADGNGPEAYADRLAVACELVKQVGKDARRAWQAGGLTVESKGDQDFVTDIDRDTERAIRSALLNAFPGDTVMGEEFGGGDPESMLWVVDPIDGTSNFIRGLSDWAVSLALIAHGTLVLGVIYDGGRDRLYHARTGAGAFCDGAPIKVSAILEPADALVTIGTSGRIPLEDHLADLRAIRRSGAEYRRHGSAATGLLMVADGRTDVYVERHLNPWDALGGLCIAQQAGAVSALPEIGSFLADGGPVLCAAPGVFAPFARWLRMTEA